jgi:phosphoribosylformylglycinamidine synthase
MLVLPGAPALSRFRLDKLLRALKSIDPRVVAVDAYFHHFVDLARPLAPAESGVLERLLDADLAPQPPRSGAMRLFTPRAGTISKC